MSESGYPQTPGEPRSRRAPGGGSPLEAVLVLLVFAAGGALAFAGFKGETKAEPSAAFSPTAPQPGPPSPPPFVEPPILASGPVFFSRADSMANPVGCDAELVYTWVADPSSDPPYGEEALIRVTGPQVAGDYFDTLTRQGLELRLNVQLSGSDLAWTARVVSIGERKADSFPLEITFSNAFC